MPASNRKQTSPEETPKKAPGGIAKDIMDMAQAVGIEKRDIGKAILKSALTGKLEIPGLSEGKAAARKRLDIVTENVIKLAWTFFSIFMLFQLFVFVTTRLM